MSREACFLSFGSNKLDALDAKTGYGLDKAKA